MRRSKTVGGSGWVIVGALVALGACDGPVVPEPDGQVHVDGGPGVDGGARDAGGRDAGASCAADADCDDGLFCSGVEACDPSAPDADARGCVAGAAPCAAGESCMEEAGTCDACGESDADGDGHESIACGGDDCDDENPDRFPGNAEICDSDDEDCDPATVGARDSDSDGYHSSACCNGATCGDDCNDSLSAVHPTQAEVCDELDNDCDSDVDEGAIPTFYSDADGDGYGTDDPTAPTHSGSCFPPEGFAATSDDCDDDPTTGRPVHPGAVDTCDPAMIDQDCDGTPNNPPEGCACTGTMSRACVQPGACAAGIEMCLSGEWGACSIAPSAETCNGADDNCNGSTDEGLTVTCFDDLDNDTYAPAGATMRQACPVAGRGSVGGCPINSTNRYPVGLEVDCSDTDVRRSPAGTETCNATDDDCDTLVDEALTVVCYSDLDADGFAASGTPAMEVCPRAGGGCPTQMTSRVPVGVGNVDCADLDSTRSPLATETCNFNDDDCDSRVDEAVSIRCYTDADDDTYAPSAAVARDACMVAGRTMWGGCPFGETARPPGTGSTDCDDAWGPAHPGGTEICDFGVRDEDCDGVANPTSLCSCASGTMRMCPEPGACGAGMQTCTAGAWGACSVEPRDESCNSSDDDCDGTVDEGMGIGSLCYRDVDGDGYAAAGASTAIYCVCPMGWTAQMPVTGETDCDDLNAAFAPHITEACDEIDHDCSSGGGVAPDEDVDGDGYASTAHACVGGPLPKTDCDDTNPAVRPGATEVCNWIDDNCDGTGSVGGGICPSGCTERINGDDVYILCLEYDISVGGASSRCTALGSRLVRIDDSEENTFLASLCANTACSGCIPNSDCVIGATDSAEEGVWRWRDGTHFWTGGSSGSAVGGAYENWSSTHPACSSPYPCAQDCAILRASGSWTSVTCGQMDHQRYICEQY